MKALELELDIFEVLEKVQEEINYIPRYTDVKEDYRIYRSLRRGCTNHTINMKMVQRDIERNNR